MESAEFLQSKRSFITHWRSLHTESDIFARKKINTTSRCVNHVYTLPPKPSSIIKNNRIRFVFLPFCIRSMHFDRKGWGIQKTEVQNVRVRISVFVLFLILSYRNAHFGCDKCRKSNLIRIFLWRTRVWQCAKVIDTSWGRIYFLTCEKFGRKCQTPCPMTLRYTVLRVGDPLCKCVKFLMQSYIIRRKLEL